VVRWKYVWFVAVVLATALSARPDQFDDLRLKWLNTLTQGTNSQNAVYPKWIEEVESDAYSYLNLLNVSSNRTWMWSSYTNLANDSGDVSGTYERLRAMALACAVPGSRFQNYAPMLTSLTNGLEWMTRYYSPTGAIYDNW